MSERRRTYLEGRPINQNADIRSCVQPQELISPNPDETNINTEISAKNRSLKFLTSVPITELQDDVFDSSWLFYSLVLFFVSNENPWKIYLILLIFTLISLLVTWKKLPIALFSCPLLPSKRCSCSWYNCVMDSRSFNGDTIVFELSSVFPTNVLQHERIEQSAIITSLLWPAIGC